MEDTVIQPNEPAVPERIPETLAARVLERASQLDSVESRTLALADLEAAALEAGISRSAFERAFQQVLAEDRAPPGRVAIPRPRLRRQFGAAAAAVVLVGCALGAALLFRTAMPSVPAPPPPPVIIEVPPAPPR
jgi:hypothetical protein